MSIWQQKRKELREWVTHYFRPLLYTVIMFSTTFIAFRVDETRILFLHLDASEYPIKWEFLALCCTLVLTIVYALGLANVKDDLGKFHFAVISISMFFAGIALMAALALLKSADLSLHYWSVLAVAVIFLFADGVLLLGTKKSPSPQRWAALATFWLADLPVVFALGTLLTYFLFVHPQTHRDFVFPGREYFFGGAIAFQWMSSNIVFMMIAWLECKQDRRKACSVDSGMPLEGCG